MEISLLKPVLDSITVFFQLSSCESTKHDPVQKYHLKIEEILKLLKPILDATIDAETTSYEMLQKAFSGLLQSVHEVTEIFRNWRPLMSNVYFVLQVEALVSKIRTYGLEILELLKHSDKFLPMELSAASLEYRVMKIKNIGLGQASLIIMDAIKDQAEGLAETADSLKLNTNEELLIKAVALEKLKENAEKSDEVEYIDQMIALVTHTHDLLVTAKQSRSNNPVPIPADLCCPLSLELMTDPVIVASEQTYEREFIQKWIDLGIKVCPKTRQNLAHTHLIPNYNVKALIANWCELNNVKLYDPINNSISSQSRPYSLPVGSLTEAVVNGHVSDPETVSPRSSSDNSGDRNLNSGGLILTSPSRGDDVSLLGHNRTNSTSSTVSNSSLSQVTSAYDSDASQELTVDSQPDANVRLDRVEFETQVKKLVEDLKSGSLDAQRNATSEIGLLAKPNMVNRMLIANSGAIALLVDLLRSTDWTVKENSVTALLNLSINDNNKSTIANTGAIEYLIHVLESGSPEAKENSAATLFSLSMIDSNKMKIGRLGAIEPLVDLLGNGTPRGKRDAAVALLNLSLHHENKARIVQAGAVKYLIELMDPAFGMVDKAVSILSNLATIYEGRTSIGQEGGIPVLVEAVELGSARAKENAAAALLQLCVNRIRFCNMVLQEGPIPPLLALSKSGTPRAREKAQQLLSFFRNQRHENNGRG